MKNKILNFILVLCLIIPSMFMFSACNVSDETKNELLKSIEQLTQEIKDQNDKIDELESEIETNEQAIANNAMIDTAWSLYSQARSDFFFNNNGVRNNLKIVREDEYSVSSQSYYNDDVAGYMYSSQFDQKETYEEPYFETTLSYQIGDNSYTYRNAGEVYTLSENKKEYEYTDIQTLIDLNFDYLSLIHGSEPEFSNLPVLTKDNIASVVETDNGYKIRFETYFIEYEGYQNETKTMIILEKEVSLDARVMNESIKWQYVDIYNYEIEDIGQFVEGAIDSMLEIRLTYTYGGVDIEKMLELYETAINFEE